MKLAALLFLLFGIAFCRPAFAQDKLLLSNGNEMQVNVLELRPDSIFFTTPADSATKKIASLPRTSVFSVKYQNGKVELMAFATAENQPKPSETELYQLGMRDAKRNHKVLGTYLGTASATLLPGPLYGIPAGLVTGLALGSINVPEKKIKPSEPELLQHPSYRAGYIKQANKKKRINAAAGFGTGVGIWAGFVAAVLLTLNQH